MQQQKDRADSVPPILSSKMLHCLRDWLLPFVLAVVMLSTLPCLQAVRINTKTKTETFLSPLFSMTPGSVIEKFYYNIAFPRGHIAFKSFDAEVVDEAGNPVPLSETYLHHWEVLRYYQHKNAVDPDSNTPFTRLHQPDHIIASNNGLCQNYVIPQYYGLGSEARKTSTFVPDPYGIEVGNPAEVPPGYEEKWLLNVHAIDTRGVENKLGCMECWCQLYNITKDRFGLPLDPDYKGGLRCCYDKTQCRVSQTYGAQERRSLYMRYTVKWIDWDNSLLPVRVYIFDVTDTWKPLTDSAGHSQEHNCLIEYDVQSCYPTNKTDEWCNTTKRTRAAIPGGGYLVYGVAHQHTGGIGGTLYGEDGRVLCSSSAKYGEGHEEGYLVEMSTCYPKPGSVKINDGEIMTFESNYAPTENHRGVMGLFHIMVADKLPDPRLRMKSSKLVGETNM